MAPRDHIFFIGLYTGFPQALEIMENLENHQKSSMHGNIMEFCEIIWWNHQ